MNIKCHNKGYTLVEIMVSTAVLSMLIIMIFRMYSYGNSVFQYNYWHQSRTREIELFYEFMRNDVDRASNKSTAGSSMIFVGSIPCPVNVINTVEKPIHYIDNGGAFASMNSATEKKLLEFEINEVDTSGLYDPASVLAGTCDENYSIGKTISVQYSYQKGDIYKTRTITYPTPIQVIESRKKVLENVEKIKISKDIDLALEGNVLKVAVVVKHPIRKKTIAAEASFSIKVPFSPESSSWTWHY